MATSKKGTSGKPVAKKKAAAKKPLPPPSIRMVLPAGISKKDVLALADSKKNPPKVFPIVLKQRTPEPPKGIVKNDEAKGVVKGEIARNSLNQQLGRFRSSNEEMSHVLRDLCETLGPVVGLPGLHTPELEEIQKRDAALKDSGISKLDALELENDKALYNVNWLNKLHNYLSGVL